MGKERGCLLPVLEASFVRESKRSRVLQLDPEPV